MPVDLRETRLPGVGTKFTFRLDDGGRLAVIQHNDGVRELYFFRHSDDDEPKSTPWRLPWPSGSTSRTARRG